MQRAQPCLAWSWPPSQTLGNEVWPLSAGLPEQVFPRLLTGADSLHVAVPQPVPRGSPDHLVR